MVQVLQFSLNPDNDEYKLLELSPNILDTLNTGHRYTTNRLSCILTNELENYMPESIKRTDVDLLIILLIAQCMDMDSHSSTTKYAV